MLHRLGNYSDAIKAFSTVLNMVKNDRLVFESRGLVFQDMRDHVRAADDFTSAIKLVPDVGENYYHRGESKLRMRQFNSAVEDFQAALDKGYNEACVYNARATAMRCLQRHDEALDDLGKAVSMEPDNVEFLFNRSQTLMDTEVGDPAGAEDDLTMALERTPGERRHLTALCFQRIAHLVTFFFNFTALSLSLSIIRIG